MTHIILADPKKKAIRYRLYLTDNCKGLISTMSDMAGISEGKYASQLIENGCLNIYKLEGAKDEIKALKKQIKELKNKRVNYRVYA